jgi:membrane-associated protein
LAYLLGRAAGRRVRAWSARGRRRAAAFAWAERGLAVRGGMVLVAARYVAGGRNAATMAMGAVGYPLRSFSFFDVIGAGSWALFSALLGYVGGVAFEQQPLEGLLFGLSAAVVITVLVEVVRRARPPGRPTGSAAPTADEALEPDEAVQAEVPLQGAEPGLERSSPSEGQVA